MAELPLGSKAPDFELPGVDGRKVKLADYRGRKKAVVVVFSCNHCPYVKAYEDRMVKLQADFGARGAQVVAINSNDSTNYPQDGFEQMKQRAKEKGFSFPYLHDESQGVAQSFGAERTPHIFCLDGDLTVRYLGSIDDNWEHPDRVKQSYLRDAVEDLLAGRPVRLPRTSAIGCTIKWKH